MSIKKGHLCYVSFQMHARLERFRTQVARAALSSTHETISSSPLLRCGGEREGVMDAVIANPKGEVIFVVNHEKIATSLSFLAMTLSMYSYSLTYSAVARNIPVNSLI